MGGWLEKIGLDGWDGLWAVGCGLELAIFML